MPTPKQALEVATLLIPGGWIAKGAARVTKTVLAARRARRAGDVSRGIEVARRDMLSRPEWLTQRELRRLGRRERLDPDPRLQRARGNADQGPGSSVPRISAKQRMKADAAEKAARARRRKRLDQRGRKLGWKAPHDPTAPKGD